MTMTDDRERKAAEAKFKKSERATEGAKAMSEYNAERQAERAKTVRLKALREAKEAAESGPRRSGATSKSPGLTLSPDDPLVPSFYHSVLLQFAPRSGAEGLGAVSHVRLQLAYCEVSTS
jgi:hypothetical protein